MLVDKISGAGRRLVWFLVLVGKMSGAGRRLAGAGERVAWALVVARAVLAG